MLLGLMGCHNDLVSSAGSGTSSGVVSRVFGGACLHCPPHRPSAGFAGLTQSTAAMSLRFFSERGENKRPCIQNTTSQPYLHKINPITNYFNKQICLQNSLNRNNSFYNYFTCLLKIIMVTWQLLQGRHLCRQLVPPRSTADCLQPILPLILCHILHRLILRGHDVTGPKADVVEDGTCCYDLK